MRRLPYWLIVIYTAILAYVVPTAGWSVFRRFFSYDDAFFYLTIARNVARGAGSTFDRIAPTNGYEPLWLGIMSAAYRVAGPLTPDAGLRLAFVLAALCSVVGAVLLVRLLDRLGAAAYLQVFAVLGLLSQVGFWFFGMEAHLNVVIGGIFLGLIWQRWMSVRAPASTPMRGAWWLASAGALLALTRLDLVIWVAICLVALSLARRSAGVPMTRVMRLAAVEQGVSGLAVLVYLAFNRVVFGHWLPISAALKSKPLGFSWTDLQIFRPIDGVQGMVIVLAAAAMLVWVVRVGLRSGAASLVASRIGFGGLLALCVLGHVTILLLFSNMVDPRYLVLPSYAVLLIGAIGATEFCAAAPAASQRLLRWAVTAASLVFAAVLSGVVARNVPASTPPLGGLAPFREAIMKYVNRDTIIFQQDAAGETAWFCDCRLINGDGLVNSWDYQRYVTDRRIAEYLSAVGTEFVVDIDNNTEPATTDFVWVNGFDWKQGVDFPIVGYRTADAVVRVGRFRLFRYPGSGISPR